MVGEEYGRTPAWQSNPEAKTQFMIASPCEFIDLPQSLLEPILVRRATSDGWEVRYNTKFVKYKRDSSQGPFYTEVLDESLNQSFTIKSKYLFGCDGAGSRVVKQLDLPLNKNPPQGHAMNIVVNADLAPFMGNRKGFLHWVVQTEKDCPLWARMTAARMIRPWHEWMFIIIMPQTTEELAALPSDEEFLSYMSKWIGDDSIPIKILSKSKWRVNDTVATRYDDGSRRIFGLGDAVHRHPPNNGLGSNTCIQDAYNLAWKVAYVEKGLAHESLLDSYSAERQPIGQRLVKKSNTTVANMFKIWQAMGVLLDDVKDRRAHFDELMAPTETGKKRDEKGSALDWHWEEYVKNLQRSTYPGHRLPHAELFHRISNKAQISTIDLAGHGAFCIITGIGGDSWKVAAKVISARLGIPVNAYSIGWKQDWEDLTGDWSRLREIEEDGCLLCRPDRTIAWRSMEMRDDATECLLDVVKTILGINESSLTNGGGEIAPLTNEATKDTSLTNGAVEDALLANGGAEDISLANDGSKVTPSTNGGNADTPSTNGVVDDTPQTNKPIDEKSLANGGIEHTSSTNGKTKNTLLLNGGTEHASLTNGGAEAMPLTDGGKEKTSSAIEEKDRICTILG
ncbi:hypothetical protein K470DRAFT_296256 [Piedraia hortae CBS 480.64]|uniref:FAD-binding domain-containing protein n=1 Tax=Piedraia hortae CBS 480.64 TaxID=1314780 RepID=A0A6A7BUF9_9PEZI|nr:hypothetical protein K470DRAFT_296256 [Piedraia hortae CBS 480.64]